MSPHRSVCLLAVVGSSIVLCCARGDGAAPGATSTPIASIAPTRPPAEPTSPPGTDSAGTTPAAGKPTPADQWVDGKPVSARGRISNTPWQHMVGTRRGKQPEYFDLEGGGTIIYVAETPRCPGLIHVSGLVVEVRGPSKRPGEKPSKVDDTYRELHIDVTEHRCLP